MSISRISHAFIRLIVIASITYVVTVAVIVINKTSYIYFPNQTDFYACSYFADDEKIEQNGTRMYYRQNGADLVLVYHGNAGRACDRNYYAKPFDNNNISYLLVEYTGYAGSSNKPSRKNILKDVQNVIDTLERLEYDTLTVIGESIGTGVALEHTKIAGPDKLVLIAPFTSLQDVARFHYPFLPSRFIGPENYDNMSTISSYTGKLLIMHGTNDTIIPTSMGESIFGQAKTENKEFVRLQEKGHNDILTAPNFFSEITEFILK